jgi:tRNA (guanine-N7-)-methyltransferase
MPMTQEKLSTPFSWEDSITMIEDRVWYVSERIQAQSNFTFPGWDDPLLFGNNQPVCIEYCSGNGAWIAEKAMSNPHLNWVAVERKFARVKKIWGKIKRLQLNNLIVLCGEGHHATCSYFSNNSIKEIYINFPDPWPKNRHAKNRLIQAEFVKELFRVLQENCVLTFVTDDIAYSKGVTDLILGQGMFHSLYPSPFYFTEHPAYGSSYFDQLWRSKERLIRYHQFKKQSI